MDKNEKISNNIFDKLVSTMKKNYLDMGPLKIIF